MDLWGHIHIKIPSKDVSYIGKKVSGNVEKNSQLYYDSREIFYYFFKNNADMLFQIFF